MQKNELKTKKLILITSNIAPYRLLWCEELAKHLNVTIYYTKDKEVNYNDNFLKHKSKKCQIIKMSTKRDDGLDPLCFDVIKIINNNKDSFIIFDGYGPKTNLLGLVYSKLIGKKTYVNIDGYPTERKVNKLRDFIRGFTIKNLCDNFFCGGDNVKDYLIHYGANKDNICIHNFSSIRNKQIIDKPLNKKEKLEIREKLKIEEKGNIVLGVGRFVELKRFEDLIEAIKKCKTKCSLYLLGGKPTSKYLELVGSSTNIKFIDFVLPEDVDNYYKMANLFVLPSRTDVWGLVINEAMSKGLPVISSDSPVAAKNLVKGNGYIFKTYDIDELAKDIDKCLDLNNNKKMSKRSLEIVKDYTIEGMVERQLPIIKKYFKL